MSAILTGIGTATPAYSATQEEAARYHAELTGIDEAEARTLRALYRRSGIRSRGSALLDRAEGGLAERQNFFRIAASAGDRGPGTAERMARFEAHAPELAIEAAERALADDASGAFPTAPGQITHLVVVSCTGFVSPGVDAQIIERLDLDRGVQRTQVGFMGCHGALNGLRVARGFVEADPQAVVLLTAVELCSLHFAYTRDSDALVANALFADGAAAAVCRQVGHDPDPSHWRVADCATHLFPDSAGEMTWRIGDHGFRMTLSPRVPERIRGGLGEWIDRWLEGHGLGRDEVASWAIHPGGPRILDAAETALGLERERTTRSREVLAAHGNMSSATILFILERLRTEGAPRPAVGIAFGPGLAVEAVLFT